jgi:hypothetical protein
VLWPWTCSLLCRKDARIDRDARHKMIPVRNVSWHAPR